MKEPIFSADAHMRSFVSNKLSEKAGVWGDSHGFGVRMCYGYVSPRPSKEHSSELDHNPRGIVGFMGSCGPDGFVSSFEVVGGPIPTVISELTIRNFSFHVKSMSL